LIRATTATLLLCLAAAAAEAGVRVTRVHDAYAIKTATLRSADGPGVGEQVRTEYEAPAGTVFAVVRARVRVDAADQPVDRIALRVGAATVSPIGRCRPDGRLALTSSDRVPTPGRITSSTDLWVDAVFVVPAAAAGGTLRVGGVEAAVTLGDGEAPLDTLRGRVTDWAVLDRPQQTRTHATEPLVQRVIAEGHRLLRVDASLVPMERTGIEPDVHHLDTTRFSLRWPGDGFAAALGALGVDEHGRASVVPRHRRVVVRREGARWPKIDVSLVFRIPAGIDEYELFHDTARLDRLDLSPPAATRPDATTRPADLVADAPRDRPDIRIDGDGPQSAQGRLAVRVLNIANRGRFSELAGLYGEDRWARAAQHYADYWDVLVRGGTLRWLEVHKEETGRRAAAVELIAGYRDNQRRRLVIHFDRTADGELLLRE